MNRNSVLEGFRIRQLEDIQDEMSDTGLKVVYGR